MTLTDADLSGFWRDADAASGKGQQRTLLLARVRLWGAVAGALGGAFAWSLGRLDVFALLAALGFVAALIAELLNWHLQPERDWYAGRAMAESAKTLCWRFAVGADPFPVDMDGRAARDLLLKRFSEVAKKAHDRVTIDPTSQLVTDKMLRLRAADFATRRDAYLAGRTGDQRGWYSREAESNARAATRWRLLLVTGEVLAAALSVTRLAGGVQIDYAGILAAIVAAGAAWVAQKQFTNLASAYRVATRELAVQEDYVRRAVESEWQYLAADTEEAISREHTMWLASRLGSESD